jgi:hypothetical protein
MEDAIIVFSFSPVRTVERSRSFIAGWYEIFRWLE